MRGVNPKVELAVHKEVAQFGIRAARSSDEAGQVPILPVVCGDMGYAGQSISKPDKMCMEGEILLSKACSYKLRQCSADHKFKKSCDCLL